MTSLRRLASKLSVRAHPTAFVATTVAAAPARAASSAGRHAYAAAAAPGARPISSSSLTTALTETDERFVAKPPNQHLQFGVTLSDHMLMVEWTNANGEASSSSGGVPTGATPPSGGGWSAPRIVPTQDLRLSPAASCLHYGLQCFEGMKAYRTLSDPADLRLFRPDLNMQRLQSSMDRLQMLPPSAQFDPDELLECIKELVRVDEQWVPHGDGYSLYIRPTVIATHPHLGLSAPDSMLLYVITCPVGPYYKSGFAPVRLTADTEFVRAWPGGTGNVKIGGNYAPTMKAGAQANGEGYNQVLWTFTNDEGEREVTEVGAMNVFFFLDKGDGSGRRELVTPPLDGTILPGVTRRSILDLTRSWGEFDVTERFPTMDEIRNAAREGRLIEAFGAGTAAIVSPIECIRYQGEDIEIEATGDLTRRVWDELTAIQYGKVEGPEGWSVRV